MSWCTYVSGGGLCGPKSQLQPAFAVLNIRKIAIMPSKKELGVDNAHTPTAIEATKPRTASRPHWDLVFMGTAYRTGTVTNTEAMPDSDSQNDEVSHTYESAFNDKRERKCGLMSVLAGRM